MDACMVVYKLYCSRRSDNFSRVDSISDMCFSSILFYYHVIPLLKLTVRGSWLQLLVG